MSAFWVKIENFFLGKSHFFGPLFIFFVNDVCFQTQKSSNKWSISIAYPLSTRCFSPESIPGVSIIVTHFNTGLLNVEPWNRFKKAPPNLDKGRNCFLLSTAKAFPGITCKKFTHEFLKGPYINYAIKRDAQIIRQNSTYIFVI